MKKKKNKLGKWTWMTNIQIRWTRKIIVIVVFSWHNQKLSEIFSRRVSLFTLFISFFAFFFTILFSHRCGVDWRQAKDTLRDVSWDSSNLNSKRNRRHWWWRRQQTTEIRFQRIHFVSTKYRIFAILERLFRFVFFAFAGCLRHLHQCVARLCNAFESLWRLTDFESNS